MSEIGMSSYLLFNFSMLRRYRELKVYMRLSVEKEDDTLSA